MIVRQIRIDFNVTPQVSGYVFVYVIEAEKGCILKDSGVACCEYIIEKKLLEDGNSPYDIKAVLLTHAHPDHIGTAAYFREKYGAKIYCSTGERAWIEDIDKQYSERPIPNFYKLAGRSVIVDRIIKDGDTVDILKGVSIKVIGTPGHSADEISYKIEDMVFIGDSICGT